MQLAVAEVGHNSLGLLVTTRRRKSLSDRKSGPLPLNHVGSHPLLKKETNPTASFASGILIELGTLRTVCEVDCLGKLNRELIEMECTIWA